MTENEWQPVRIAPVEKVESECGPFSDETSRQDFKRFVGLVVHVKPWPCKLHGEEVFAVHPNDWGKLEITSSQEDLLCIHQILAD